MLNSQGLRPDFRCGQGVKHENLLGQDLDLGCGWKYKRLCSVPPPPLSLPLNTLELLPSVLSWGLVECFGFKYRAVVLYYSYF